MAKRTAKTEVNAALRQLPQAAAMPDDPVGDAMTAAGLGNAAAPVPSTEQAQPTVPNIDVLERRLLEPFGTGSTMIQLKDKSMICRWVNANSRPGRLEIAKTQQGWVPVHVSELADADTLTGATIGVDGTVRRGERGQTILMKMPHEYYERIQMAKADALRRRQQSSAATKADVAEAAARKYGPQAGDFVDAGIKTIGEVIETRERVES